MNKKLTTVCGIFLVVGNFLNVTRAADRVPGAAAKPAAYFYTGKPYDKDLAVYLYSARSYSPNVIGWTTQDPSGFPDGANNRIYAPVPTFCIDPTGESARPTAAAFWGAYAPVDYTSMPDNNGGHQGADQAYASVGGYYNSQHLAGNADYAESCALRVSIALDNNVQPIPSGAPGADTNQGGSAPAGTEYILSATKMGNYLTNAWGSADHSVGSGASDDSLSYIQGLLKDPGWVAVCVMPGNHVGVVTGSKYGNYSDPFTPDDNAMNIWILE